MKTHNAVSRRGFHIVYYIVSLQMAFVSRTPSLYLQEHFCFL
jgi:hypothetical protein